MEIGRRKCDVLYVAGEDQGQDPDAEGELEIDIEPFQDPSFNAERSSPTSPTSPTSSSTSSKSKSRSKSNSGVGDEPQPFVSSFYIPPVPPHVQQQQGRKKRRWLWLLRRWIPPQIFLHHWMEHRFLALTPLTTAPLPLPTTKITRHRHRSTFYLSPIIPITTILI